MPTRQSVSTEFIRRTSKSSCLNYPVTAITRNRSPNISEQNDGTYTWFEEYTTPIYEQGELVAVQGVIRNMDAAKTKTTGTQAELYRKISNYLKWTVPYDGLLKEMMQASPVPAENLHGAVSLG